MLWIAFSLVLLMFINVVDAQGNQQLIFPRACNLYCRQGTRCALVEPKNCYGCTPHPQCVQQECNTSCNLRCPFLSTCVLVNSASACCPIAACRSQFPFFPPATTTPRYSTVPPYTTTPRYPRPFRR
ncbi:hypothetical protein V3C99_001962 [Haemonchus contortus]